VVAADFAQTIRDAYAVEGAAVDLARGVHGGALAAAGAPVFVADVKGDVSGLAAPSEPGQRMERAAPAPAEPTPAPRGPRAPAPAETTAEKVGEFLTSSRGRALQRQVLRGVFGMLRKRL
jgi:hypothetical protein